MRMSLITTALAAYATITFAIIREPQSLTSFAELSYWSAVVASGLSTLIAGFTSASSIANYRRKTYRNLLESTVDEICAHCGETNVSVRASFMKKHWYLCGRMSIYTAHGVYDWRELVLVWGMGQGCSGRALCESGVVWADLSTIQPGSRPPLRGARSSVAQAWRLTKRQASATRSLGIVVSLRVVKEGKVVGVVNLDDVCSPQDSLILRNPQVTKIALEGLATDIARQ